MSYLLLKASACGDAGKVRELLAAGDSVDYVKKNGTGRTALADAALCGNLDIVELLIQNGANLNHRDQAVGYGPLHWSCNEGHLEVVRRIVEAGADLNLPSEGYGFTPLMVVSRNGRIDLVNYLLEAGADVHACTVHYQNALTLAEAQGKQDVVAILKARGATMPVLPVLKTLAWPDVSEDLSSVDHNAPESVVRGFILSMYRWEVSAGKAHREAGESAQSMTGWWARNREAQQSAMAPFCTAKTRTYGRCGSFSSMNPEHDPGEVLLGVSYPTKTRAEVLTRSRSDHAWKYEYLYVLLKKDGRWLIDSKKMRPIGFTKWENTIL